MTQHRDYSFDNLRGLCIFLVVLGHIIPLTVSIADGNYMPIKYLHTVIFSFHMPVFIFISGYFTRHDTSLGEYHQKLVRSVFLPFVVVNSLFWVAHSRSLSRLLYPQFTLWFLLALFYWKLAVHSIARFRFAIIISFVLTLYIGVTGADQFLALSRAIGMFPFFLAGYLVDKEQVARLKRVGTVFPVALLVACWAAIFIL